MSNSTPNTRTHTSEYLEYLLNMCVGTMSMAKEHSWDHYSGATVEKHSEKCVQEWLQRLLLQQLNAAFPGKNPQGPTDRPPCTVELEVPFGNPEIYKTADLVVTFPSQLTQAKSKAYLIEIKHDKENGTSKTSNSKGYFAIDDKCWMLTTLSDWAEHRLDDPAKEQVGITPDDDDNMKTRYEVFAKFLDAADHPVEAAGCFGINFRLNPTNSNHPGPCCIPYRSIRIILLSYCLNRKVKSKLACFIILYKLIGLF